MTPTLPMALLSVTFLAIVFFIVGYAFGAYAERGRVRARRPIDGFISRPKLTTRPFPINRRKPW
jgi:hypothetical protein